MTAEILLLILKTVVITVTILLAVSLTALAFGKYRLHGRLNIVFFLLTLAAVLGLEVVARVLSPDMFREYFDRHDSWNMLYIHLSFSLPAALILPLMLFTGLKHRRRLHIGIGLVFLVFWIGTVVTGVFFL